MGVMQEKNSKIGACEAGNAVFKKTETAEALSPAFMKALAQDLTVWGNALGFSHVGLSTIDVSQATQRLTNWLQQGFHGDMDYMAEHAALRAAPEMLLPECRSVISVSLPYWPTVRSPTEIVASDFSDASFAEKAVISRYAQGRDYHRVLRQRLKKLSAQMRAAISEVAPNFVWGNRVFSDSAPVLETEFARQAGIAWIGKHSLSLTREGSWHFLGEMYTTLDFSSALPAAVNSSVASNQPITSHCGSCRRCIDACPTQAIVAPYVVDARLCISYLTIECKGAIPPALRPLIGKRIYGCDDCQLVCPWNRFARIGDLEFSARQSLDNANLVDLFAWSEEAFNERLAGSPIRRIGHERWLRNIAVALGNAASPAATQALKTRLTHPSALVREHVIWALAQA